MDELIKKAKNIQNIDVRSYAYIVKHLAPDMFRLKKEGYTFKFILKELEKNNIKINKNTFNKYIREYAKTIKDGEEKPIQKRLTIEPTKKNDEEPEESEFDKIERKMREAKIARMMKK